MAIKITTKDFIERATKVHGDKYDYSKVEYKRTDLKVIITCSKHGDFKQLPNVHLRGAGCLKCAHENHNGSYQLSKALNNEYNFSGYLYIIKMFNENESFIKIGVSVNPKQRFQRLGLKYNIKIIETNFFEDFNIVIINEHKLHNKYSNYSYIPINYFGGMFECFNLSIIKHFI